MRLVSVTTPAPVTTPRIPSSGLVETSAGIAAAAARAISVGDGRTVMLEAAIRVRLPFRADGGDDGKPRTQSRCHVRIVERDLHRYSLHYLCEIACGVVRREERELRTA